MGYSLFLDAVEARPSVTSISVHLHIENTTVKAMGKPMVMGALGVIVSKLLRR